MNENPKQTQTQEVFDKQSPGSLPGRHKRSRRKRTRRSRSERSRKRKTLRRRLLIRLDELAKDVPYAAKLAERLRQGRDDVTLGDVIIDVTCLEAIRGNATMLRLLWERSEGKPPDPPPTEEDVPRRIKTPLGVPRK